MTYRIPRSVVILGVALVIGGAAAFGVNRFIQRQVAELETRNKPARTVRVVVPKEDLPKGAVISAEKVAVREVPAEWAHSNAVSPDQFDSVEAQSLAYPVAKGEMLLWSLFEGQRRPSFSSRLAPGRRAITVPVDEINSISGMVEPGDRIDLIVSARRDQRVVMVPLLQNMVVLATGTRAGPEINEKEGRSRAFTTITLDATPEDAQRVLAAREVGKVAALLRAPGDDARSPGAQRDALALLGLGADRSAADGGIPVLYGGRSSAAPPAAPLRPATPTALESGGVRPDGSRP